MDLKQYDISKLRGLDTKKLTEVEVEIRSFFSKKRLEFMGADLQKASEKRLARKTLARVLTVKSEVVRGKTEKKVASVKKATKKSK